MTNNRHLTVSLTVITAMLVVLIAALAGGSLWALHQVHGQMAHDSATRSALDRGRQIMGLLAAQPIVRHDQAGESDWSQFSRQAHSLHAMENGLQYVSVLKDGVTVFHEQMTALDGAVASAASESRPPADILVSRRLLGVGGESLPVVVLVGRITGDDGKERVIEVALKKDAVGREEQAMAGTIGSLFRLSLITVAVAFGICMVLVVWMMRREAGREQQRREEEHLAFAGVLANGVVHDFRNPMSSLRLDAQMLSKEVEKGPACRTDRLTELSGRMRHTLDRMDKVFQEFLYMSKPGHDGPEQFDLVAGVKDSAAILQPRLEQKTIRIDLDLPAGPVRVTGYETAVRRALMNVITNAEQFSPEGGTIGLRLSSSGSHAVLEVLDAGPGVPPAQLDRIFDMFVTTRPGGTGLGLFLAKAAVEKCGGTIRAGNRPEGGACFRIELPLAQGRQTVETTA